MQQQCCYLMSHFWMVLRKAFWSYLKANNASSVVVWWWCSFYSTHFSLIYLFYPFLKCVSSFYFIFRYEQNALFWLMVHRSHTQKVISKTGFVWFKSFSEFQDWLNTHTEHTQFTPTPLPPKHVPAPSVPKLQLFDHHKLPPKKRAFFWDVDVRVWSHPEMSLLYEQLWMPFLF